MAACGGMQRCLDGGDAQVQISRFVLPRDQLNLRFRQRVVRAAQLGVFPLQCPLRRLGALSVLFASHSAQRAAPLAVPLTVVTVVTVVTARLNLRIRHAGMAVQGHRHHLHGRGWRGVDV